MTQQKTSEATPLVAPHELEYPYTRSVGPVIGRFFGALMERKILGIVLVPPTEYDPLTAEPLSDFVDVDDAGVVTTWAWIAEPRKDQPLNRPFAWALIRLDGANTAMLHAVDAGDESRMSTGMRVRARWRDERVGEMRDIECFVPEDSP
jgi:uncharacterized OB-fold protein